MFQRFRKIWKCQYCWPSYFNVSLHSFGRFQIFRKRRRPLERIFLKINEWSWNYMNNYQGISLIIHWFSGKSFNLGSIFSIIKDTWCMYIYMIIYVCNNIYIVGSIFVRTNGSVRFLADGRSLGQDADLYSEHLVHNHHRTALRLGVSMVFRGTGEALSKFFSKVE